MEPNEECHEVFVTVGTGGMPSSGSEGALTSRTRIERVKFRDYVALLYGSKLSLKMKGIQQSCVRSAMLYGRETW